MRARQGRGRGEREGETDRREGREIERDRERGVTDAREASVEILQ